MDATKFETKNDYINAKKYSETKALQIPLEVIGVAEVEIGDETKLVMCFGGVQDVLALNKTNLKTMIEAKGKETDNWKGALVSLALIPATYAGAAVKSVIISKVQ